ncbi:hypothetical protein CVT25_007010 [Psilocybe cyanescens]|uniref:Uncharacterized protein n=1 Tax=Psilocybe cyanescens TaxID=93625 RepID=A0A409WYD0_PSICY|nr:hypothetical protein CVT25_007010 [Psilocybe cyanescens]
MAYSQIKTSLTPEERLEIELRNEKIKRVEDYIFYQSELNYWKKECKLLEEKIEDREAIHESMDHILDQHGSYYRDELRRLRLKIEDMEAELEEEDNLLIASTNIIATICDKLAKVFASYNFKSTATD